MAAQQPFGALEKLRRLWGRSLTRPGSSPNLPFLTPPPEDSDTGIACLQVSRLEMLRQGLEVKVEVPFQTPGLFTYCSALAGSSLQPNHPQLINKLYSFACLNIPVHRTQLVSLLIFPIQGKGIDGGREESWIPPHACLWSSKPTWRPALLCWFVFFFFFFSLKPGHSFRLSIAILE